MKDRIQFVSQDYLDANGDFQWPTNEADRNQLASRLLGACIVAATDYWIEKAIPKIESDLPIDQQNKMKQILFDTVRGVVFSILVKLDQFPFANLDLVLSDVEKDERLASIVEGDIFDLHDRLFGWVEKFSEYPKEFLRKRARP